MSRPLDCSRIPLARHFSGIVINRVRLPLSNIAGQTNQFDELRIGATFADVTGIPEPGSASLLALGALLLVRSRRF